MFQGKNKAITFSYDDGVIQDKRLIPLLDKYGLKATFNLNSELFGMTHINHNNGKPYEHIKIQPNEVRELYERHEVAVHTLTHPRLTELSDEEVVRQVEQDRTNLSQLVGYEVIGMAYPCGGINHDARTEKLIRQHTGIQYCRTITSTYSFAPQKNLYQFHPTVHHLDADGKTYDICERFLASSSTQPQLLYIWGHSYEMDFGDRWNEIEALFALLGKRPDVFYGTNKEIFGLI